MGMRHVIKIASSFIAVIIGAGFASGQEILIFFVSFGYKGFIGALLAALLFGYFGMLIISLGSKLQVTSYRDVIVLLAGKGIGTIIDVILLCTLFGVGVVMLAGAGTIVEQQLEMPAYVGSLVMAVIVIITMMFDIDKIMTMIGLVIPVLVVAIVWIAIYAWGARDVSFAHLQTIARIHPTPINNGLFAALTYVSSNLAGGAGMALLIGGAEPNVRRARLGGLLGGLGIGLLLLIACFAIFARLNVVVDVDMPLLALMSDMSDLFGLAMSVILFMMIYSTAVGMFYALITRFFKAGEKFILFPISFTVMLGFMGSFIGFTELVTWFYPVMGYFGFLLMFVFLLAPLRLRKK